VQVRKTSTGKCATNKFSVDEYLTSLPYFRKFQNSSHNITHYLLPFLTSPSRVFPPYLTKFSVHHHNHRPTRKWRNGDLVVHSFWAKNTHLFQEEKGSLMLQILTELNRYEDISTEHYSSTWIAIGLILQEIVSNRIQYIRSFGWKHSLINTLPNFAHKEGNTKILISILDYLHRITNLFTIYDFPLDDNILHRLITRL